jgi:hypothetical protein
VWKIFVFRSVEFPLYILFLNLKIPDCREKLVWLPLSTASSWSSFVQTLSLISDSEISYIQVGMAIEVGAQVSRLWVSSWSWNCLDRASAT